MSSIPLPKRSHELSPLEPDDDLKTPHRYCLTVHTVHCLQSVNNIFSFQIWFGKKVRGVAPQQKVCATPLMSEFNKFLFLDFCQSAYRSYHHWNHRTMILTASKQCLSIKCDFKMLNCAWDLVNFCYPFYFQFKM